MIDIYIPFFKTFSAIYSQVFSFFSFSVGDRIYFILGILIILGIFSLYRNIKYKKWDKVFFSFKKVLIFINIFIFIFYVFWGFLYFKKSLQYTYPAENITLSELEKLSEKYLQKCIETRGKSIEDKNGVYKLPKSNDTTALFIHQSQLLNVLPFKTFYCKKNIKKSLFSPVLSYLGIAGYFNPFTYEAQYNEQIPDTNKPFSMAHEMAHQLGYAYENEANFVGFLACINAKNEAIQYSANYMVLRYLLREINEKDSIFVKQIIKKYSDGMKRDRAFEKLYYSKYEGKIEEGFAFLNDFYLKFNNQEGVESYSKFVELLVGWERKNK